jgi:hypothetical protein
LKEQGFLATGIPESRVLVAPFGVSAWSRRWSHGVGKRGAKELVNPILGFGISKDREPGRARTKEFLKRESWKRLLVRPVVITIDHMEEDKGRASLC